MAFGLVCAVLLLYWQTQGHVFLYDDELYISENPFVLKGLSKEGLFWSFRFTEEGTTYWHPLTWISHMMDVELFGVNPAFHHLMNVALHALNAMLLFGVLRMLTGRMWESAVVALFFAVHPINVESVAWAAERKNVLSTFFWLLTLAAYSWYARRNSIGRYLVILLCFSLGLMAKPMLVSLPIVLLLIDVWPLGRWSLPFYKDSLREKDCAEAAIDINRPPAWVLLLEKIPLLLLSIAAVWLAISSVDHSGSVHSASKISITLRVANLFTSYLAYLGKLFWPHPLAMLYPYPSSIPLWQALAAFLLQLTLTLLVLTAGRRKPYLFVGWFWFCVTLLPVSGLVQTGLWPAMADRWAYVPFIGLFIILVWGGADILVRIHNSRKRHILAFGLASLIALGFSFKTWAQISTWRTPLSLYDQAIRFAPDNFVINLNYANALQSENRFDEAIIHYKKAIQIDPLHFRPYLNLGNLYMKSKQPRLAFPYYKQAFDLNPDSGQMHLNMGNYFEKIGSYTEAESYFRNAVQLNPEDAKTHYHLGALLEKVGRLPEAENSLLAAISLDPALIEAYNVLGIVYWRQGDMRKTIATFQKALALDPSDSIVRMNLSRAQQEGRMNLPGQEGAVRGTK